MDFYMLRQKSLYMVFMAYLAGINFDRQDLESAAEVLYKRNLGIRRDEKVAILYDGWPGGQRIVDALLKMGAELCGNGCVKKIKIDSYLIRDASSQINSDNAELDCDVLLAVTGKSVTHAKEVVGAIRRGTRGFSMPGITEYNFVRPAYTDMARVGLMAECVKKHLHGLSEITICTGEKRNEPEDLYKLTLYLDRNSGIPFRDDGAVTNPGIIRNWPFGEYAAMPKYRMGSGEVLIDLSSETDNPFLLHIENGEIAGWDENAKPFVDLLSKHMGGKIVAELGFGINPDMCFSRSISNQRDTLSNEKMAYTVHLGFGNNTNFGGGHNVKIHKDGVIILPRLFSGAREINLWESFDEILLLGRPDFSQLRSLQNHSMLL